MGLSMPLIVAGKVSADCRHGFFFSVSEKKLVLLHIQ